MTVFVSAHAAHADAATAVAEAIAAARRRWQAAAADAQTPTLGLLYFTDHLAGHAHELLAACRRAWPDTAWAGSVAVGVIEGDTECIDEPAVALMLAALPREHFALFSGTQPPRADRLWTALVHADPSAPDIADMIAELSERSGSGYLFGGLASSRYGVVHLADEVFSGGLSGVAFAREVPLRSRVTQGCQPIGPVRTVTAARQHIVESLDGEPALPLLLHDLGIAGSDARAALPRLRATLVGLTDAGDAMLGRGGQFGSDVRVRHLIGLDPARRAFAVSASVEPGMRLSFCSRDVNAARRDLVRICTELRDELESDATLPDVSLHAGAPDSSDSADSSHAPASAVPDSPDSSDSPAACDRRSGAEPGTAPRIAAAIYVSCAGRGGPHFGAPSAEARMVRHALGDDVPLIGFFAGGEIAHRHLYGYTGVLTVFTQGA
jgi:small ligand-binding sensory domain FIST